MCYERDKKRYLAGAHQTTDLNMANVDPSSWNKMNVSHAKAPFSHKTLNEIFTYLMKTLDISCNHNDKVYFEGTHTECKDLFEKYKERLQCIAGKVSDLPKTDIRRKDYCSLEFSVHVFNIFNNGFLNKNLHATKDNIDDIEKRMHESLKYFDIWFQSMDRKRKAQKDFNKQNKNKELEDKEDYTKQCIDVKTYHNLRVAICVFFKYACMELFRVDGPKYVPFLFGNQSLIESTFSKARSLNEDTTCSFAEQAGIMDWTRDTKKQLLRSNNKCYYDDEDEIVIAGKHDSVIGYVGHERKKTVKKWLEEKYSIEEEIEISIIDIDKSLQDLKLPSPSKSLKQKWLHPEWELLLQNMGRRNLSSYFSTFILETTNFIEYCELSVEINNELTMWFKNYCQLLKEEDNKFDKACQAMISYIFHTYHKTCIYGPYHDNNIFWNQVYKDMVSIGDKSFYEKNFIKLLPDRLQKQRTCIYVLFEILVVLVENWMDDDLRCMYGKMRITTTEMKLTEDMVSDKVNAFVGFAVRDCIRLLRKELICNEEKCEIKRDEKNLKLDLYKNIRLLHKDAMKDENYRKTKYSQQLQLTNLGGLTLIRNGYFSFAKTLMDRIRSNLNFKMIDKYCNGIFNIVKYTISKDKELLQIFKDNVKREWNNILMEEKLVNEVFLELIEKTVRSKFKQVMFNYKEVTCSRCAKENVDSTLRGELKVITAKEDKRRGDVIMRKK